jgi:pyruvate ferredoxin oxidoreductase beta subunit
VLFICYDNQAYMNTGVQRSAATPPAARTATTPAAGPHPGDRFGPGKNAPLTAMAHEIPYLATAAVAGLHDLEYKVGRRHCRSALPAACTSWCRALPGWAARPATPSRSRGPAEQTGLFPVFEAAGGDVTSVSKIRRQAPAEDRLKLQARYAHLLTTPGGAATITRLQQLADRNIARSGLLAGEGGQQPAKEQ